MNERDQRLKKLLKDEEKVCAFLGNASIDEFLTLLHVMEELGVIESGSIVGMSANDYYRIQEAITAGEEDSDN